MLTTSLLLVSQVVQAGVIEYNGYARNESSNIVTGGGLEWLKWDVTTASGKSVGSIFEHYEENGWRLASTENITALLNSFQLGKSDWGFDKNKGSYQYASEEWNITEDSSHNKILELFGFTYYSAGAIDCTYCTPASDPITYSKIFFGDKRINSFPRIHIDGQLKIEDDSSYIGYSSSSHSHSEHATTIDYFPGGSIFVSPDTVLTDWGFAFVRDIDNSSPAPVSAPGAFSLFTLSLFGVAYSSRRNRLTKHTNV